MYENDKSLNEKAPDFSGPVTMPSQEERRIACWKTVSKDGNTKFLSARIGDSTPRVVEPARDQTIIENESVLGGVDDPDDIRSKDQMISEALARTHDPKTSWEAAEKVDTNKLESLVLRALKDFGNVGGLMMKFFHIYTIHKYGNNTQLSCQKKVVLPKI